MSKLKEKIEKVKRPRMTLLFIRMGWSPSKKPLQIWYRLNGETPEEQRQSYDSYDDAREMAFSPKGMPPVSPGMTYTFEFNPDNPGSIYPSSRHFAGVFNHDNVTEWLAQFEAFKTAAKVRRQETQAKHRNIFENLDPFRRAYRNLPADQGAALLARMIQYVQGYKR